MRAGQVAAALLLLLAGCMTPGRAQDPSQAQAQGPGSTAFVGLLGQPTGGLPGAAPNASGPEPVCEGQTPAKLVIESVVPTPAPGTEQTITIRNQGGQTANMTGYRVATAAPGENATSGPVLTIGSERACRSNTTLTAGDALVFRPRSETNVCGFPFTLNASGSVTLYNAEGGPVSSLSWADSQPGAQTIVTDYGTGSQSQTVPPGNVLEVLRALGQYETLLQALDVAGITPALQAASDPNYAGPQLPDELANLQVQFPWWFTQGQPAPPPAPVPAPVEPPPPAAAGIPAAGPYTILAPNDDAFDSLLTTMGNGRMLPREALFRLPQLKDILTYHIIPGRYTTEYMRNNTPVYTAQAVEVVPFFDGCMNEGKIMLHDSCIDKPTPDNYTCLEQEVFQKCDFPFMTSALAAQWQGGYCQRTCHRCSCAADSGITCAQVLLPDVYANNGVIQGISRVLFPPPRFTKEDAIAQAAAYNASLAAGTLPPGSIPPMGLPDGSLPGAAAAGATPGPTAPGVPVGTEPAATAPTEPAASQEPAASAAENTTAASENATDTGTDAAAASPEPAGTVGRRLFRWV